MTTAAIKAEHASFDATVNARHLLAAIKLALGTARPSPMELLTRILIEQTSHELTVASTDLSNATRVGLLRTSMRGVGSAHVHPAGLLAFVRSVARSSDDEVGLAFDRGTLTVEAGRRKLRIVAGYGEDYPTLPAPLNTVAVSLERRAFVAMLADANRFSSKDGTRPHLSGVLLQRVDGALRAVASDGTRLVKLTHAMPGTNGALSVLVPRKSVALWLRALKASRAQEAQLRANSGNAELCAGPYTITTRLVDAAFPPWEHVVPNTWERELDLPRDLVRDMARIAIAMRVGGVAPALTIKSDGKGAITITSRNEDDATLEESMPYEGGAFKVSVDARIVFDALALGREKRFGLRVSGELDAMQIVDERALAVLMPTRA